MDNLQGIIVKIKIETACHDDLDSCLNPYIFLT